MHCREKLIFFPEQACTGSKKGGKYDCFHRFSLQCRTTAVGQSGSILLCETSIYSHTNLLDYGGKKCDSYLFMASSTHFNGQRMITTGTKPPFPPEKPVFILTYFSRGSETKFAKTLTVPALICLRGGSNGLLPVIVRIYSTLIQDDFQRSTKVERASCL
jgi:hypothetical protein